MIQFCGQGYLGGNIANKGARLANQLVLQQLLNHQQWPNSICLIGEQHVLSCYSLQVDLCPIHTSIVDDHLQRVTLT